MTQVPSLVLLDAVEFGIAESERAHEVFGHTTWLRTERALCYVGGEDWIVPRRPLCHLRDLFKTTNAALNIPESHRGRELVLDVGMRGQRLGEPEVQYPARLLAITESAIWELARFAFPERWIWRHFRVRVPPELTTEPTLVISLEDNRNSVSPDEGYGSTLGYYHLYGAADPPPATVERKAEGKTGPDGATNDAPPDVVVVMCPVWDLNMPPLNVALLHAYLRAHGVRSRVEDLNIDAFRTIGEDRRWLWHPSNCLLWHQPDFGETRVWPWMDGTIARWADRLVASGAPVLAFSIASSNLYVTRRLCERIKEISPDTTIIWGGPGLPSFPHFGLGEAWDYLVFGAGEEPLLRLVRGERPPIPGVVERGESLDFEPMDRRALLTDLNRMPLLDFNGFDLDRYLEPWRLPLLTSRGCINECRYCFDTHYYSPFRSLTGRRAFEQIEYLVKRHGRLDFDFGDLLCNGDLGAAEEMSRLLAESGLGVSWGSFAVIRGDMDADLLKLMARGGCTKMHYGFESGSDRMLKAMKRGYTAEEAERVIRDTAAAGITVIINLLVGFPGETDRTIDETVEFLRKNHRHIHRVETVNPVYMMVASDLYEKPEEYGIEMNEEGWAADGTDFKKRTEWIHRIMDEVTRNGIPCYQSVHQDFTVLPEDS